MSEIKINIKLDEIWYDEFLPVTEQHWYKKLKELEWTQKQLFELLQTTLPEDMKNMMWEDFKKQADKEIAEERTGKI